MSPSIDHVASRVEARGGSAAFARSMLSPNRTPQAHRPVPFSDSVPHDSSDNSLVLFHDEKEELEKIKQKGKKVSIIGCGKVGLAAAFAMINQQAVDTLALCDNNEEKLKGEIKDLRQGSAFCRGITLEANTDYSVTTDSDLVIITAGAAQKPGESRLDLVEKNVKVMKDIVPKVLQYSPNSPICIVSNPCDIVTAIAAKIAGKSVKPGQIFGSGTVLDSSRLRSLVGLTLGVAVTDVSGFVIGEHGDSSVPVFSSLRVGGVPLLNSEDADPQLDENGKPSDGISALHAEVVESAGDVINKKGYTNWAVGLALAYLARVVVNDEFAVLPVSTCVRGHAGVEEDVYLSLPCVIGARGIERIVHLPLSQWETEMFQLSAKKTWDVQKGVWDDV